MTGDPMTIAAQAQQIVRDKRAAAVATGHDHCFETVMSHPSHIDHLVAARAAGFETRLYFVATEGPAINQSRVNSRVRHGGHDVPADRIEARYFRSIANLPLAIAASDSSLIIDNSDVAKGFRPLAEIKRGAIKHLAGKDPAVIPLWWLRVLQLIMPGQLLAEGKILKP
jgi:predicted ABC-type ATPase